MKVKTNHNSHVNPVVLKDWFQGCGDVSFLEKEIFSIPILIIFQEGLCNQKALYEIVLPDLAKMLERSGLSPESLVKSSNLPISQIPQEELEKEVLGSVFSGDFVICFGKMPSVFKITFPKHPQRSIEEPNTEVSLKGPKEGFIEEISTNVTLIRKRLKTNTFKYESFEIGERTKTKIGLLFMSDIVDMDVLSNIRTSLRNIKTDGLITINGLEELITKKKSLLIPHFGYTGRPDYAADILLSGRFIIIIDGSPTVLIAPVTLSFLIRTSEDNLSLSIQSFFSIFFRYFGLLISLLLPGLWTALLSFNPDQLPYTMLATLLLSRLGVPFQLPIEVFIMIFLFDIFKEASLRMPGPLGQTLSVVGGLIIGQAAISAGLTAPGVLVVIAVSVVASFTIINQELSIAIRVLRLFNILFSSLFGLIGFFLSSFAILTYLVNIKSFGVPFLSPFSPFDSKEFFSALGHIPKYLKSKKTNVDAEKG